MPLDNAKNDETSMTHMPRNRNKLPDADTETLYSYMPAQWTQGVHMSDA